ncbi:MAG: MBL fold metallo-hydrolase [Bacteroidetes bacterium]|nr:MBL fold metallo-hydrolase [Bacteroidota bacterium]
MITRTFQPIGQGAFYTEKHSYPNGNKFNVVYDCGSSTLTNKELQNRIRSAFAKGEIIDVLFISHFHSDHINGIEFLKDYCRIKSVIPPLINAQDSIIYGIENSAAFENEENDFDDLINNPTEYFSPNTTIIRINPYDNENSNEQEIINLQELKEGDRRNVNSTVKFQIAQWIYVPFNFEQKDRTRQLVDSLKRQGLELNSLTSIDRILGSKAKIKEAYNAIDGNLNENSMVVFSGPLDGVKLSAKIQFNAFTAGHWHYRYYASCLYTGDFNAKALPNVKAIITFIGQFAQPLGTLQIPHHGSAHNFSDYILGTHPCLCVVSVGNFNTYGHPSQDVLNSILRSNGRPQVVTENIESIYIQTIDNSSGN